MLYNLKKLRKEKGISQQQLADIISVSQQSINKYENHNIEPDIATLIQISNYFETSVDYLVGNSYLKHKIEKITPYDLNDEEAELIESYRKLSRKQKESIKKLIESILAE